MSLPQQAVRGKDQDANLSDLRQRIAPIAHSLKDMIDPKTLFGEEKLSDFGSMSENLGDFVQDLIENLRGILSNAFNSVTKGEDADLENNADASTTLFFHDAPIKGNDAQQEAARMKASFEQRLDGANFTIGKAGGGAIVEDIDGKSVEEKKEEEFAEGLERVSEQVESMRAWEAAQSKEYPGLTNGEALTVLRYMSKNADEFADNAVRTGKIQQSQRADYKQYLEWLRQQEEYKLKHAGREDLDLKTNINKADTQNPNFKTTVTTQMNEAKNIALRTDRPVEVAAEQVSNRINKGNNVAQTSFLAVDENKPVRENLFPSAPHLSEKFVAANESQVPLDAPMPQKPQVVAAISAPTNNAVL